MKMRKIIGFTLSGLFILMLLGCIGPDGDTYLAYSWVSAGSYLYDENPSTPSTVYNEEYFSTDTGTFYMEYTAWDGSNWWMNYTITAQEGDLFWTEGGDTNFEITLYSTGPTLYKYEQSLQALSYKEAPEMDMEGDSAAAIENKEQVEREMTRLPKEGSETITINGYQLKIEYGRIEEE